MIPMGRVEMSEQERMQYVKKILGTEVLESNMSGMEANVLVRFKDARTKLINTVNRKVQMQQQLAMVTEDEKNLAGQCDAMAASLCEQEERRMFDQMKQQTGSEEPGKPLKAVEGKKAANTKQ